MTTPYDLQIEAWLRRLRQALSALPSVEREGVVEEARGHLLERAAQGVPTAEALAGFGSAEAYARPFVEGFEAASALSSGRLKAMFDVVLGRIHRSLIAALAVLAVFVLAATALGGLYAMAMELIDPKHVGLWLSPTSFFLGSVDDPAGYRELLGPNVHYFAIGLILLCYVLIRLILLSTVKVFARR